MEYQYIAVYKRDEQKPCGVISRELAERLPKRNYETRPITSLRALEVIAEIASSTERVEKANS